MARLSPYPLALALGVVTAVALTACGGSGGAKLLPGDTASDIQANLREVRQLAGEGECVGAQDAAEKVTAQVQQLNGVDERLKQALEEGATRLTEVVAGCAQSEEEAEEEAFEAEEAEAEAGEESEGGSRPNGSQYPGGKERGEHGGPGKGPQGEGPPGKGRSEEAPPKGPPPSGDEGESDEGEGEAPAGGTGAPSGGLSPSTPVGGGG